MNLGEKIKHYREGRGWTLDHLSELSGVEKGTISALEVRKSSRSIFASKLAAAFGLTLDQLLSDIDYLNSPGAKAAAPTTTARKVWVIGRGEGGMPDRLWTDGDYPVGASDQYAEERTDDAHAFIVKVNGDSMAPRYMPGEYVLIEPSIAPELEDDVLVRLANGKTLIKRLLSRRGGIRLGSYSTPEVLSFAEHEITWMYYVSNRVPSHKIKHWVDESSDDPDPESRKWKW